MNDLLKFITCGSVDDGKSTLIGHLLYDAKLLYADQEKALILDSKVGSRGGAIDYSLLLDGLLAEREQGITIDVAYRYFTTDRRSFICADTPGHEEYTRNMACGASFADLAVILVDATQGVLTQTRRHTRICALMGIRSFVFAVNKMDLVFYDEEKFRAIEGEIRALQKELALEQVMIIPVSATEGDNVTEKSARLPWYHGSALLPYLETVDVTEGMPEQGFYLPVQRVSRPDHTFRGFQGQIESGQIHVGDALRALPSGENAEVKRLIVAGKDAAEAAAGQPVTVELTREIDLSRGSVLEKGSGLNLATAFEAELLWLDDAGLRVGENFLVRIGTQEIPGVVQKILYRTDINTGEGTPATGLVKNELARVLILLAAPVVLAPFAVHRAAGEFILIDRLTNATAACGTVYAPVTQEVPQTASREARAALKRQAPLAIVFRPGMDGTSTAAVEAAESLLVRGGRHTYFYRPKAGEDYRETTRHLLDAGLIVLLLLTEKDAPAPRQSRLWAELKGTGGSSPQEIAAGITRATQLDAADAPGSWVI